MSEQSLGDILSGAEPEKVENAPQEESTSQEESSNQEEVSKEADKTDEAKVEESKPEDKTSEDKEETTASEPEKDPWTKTAYLDEKKKRQERDAENASLKAKLDELQSDPVQSPDIFEDQKGFEDALLNRADQIVQTKFLQMSENFLKRQYSDYDEKKAIFIDLVKESPALKDEAEKSGDPLNFLYDQATKHLEFQKMQDIDAYKAKIKAEVKAELESEMKQTKAEKEALNKQESEITPSLANAKASDKSAPEDNSLESLFG